MIDSNLPHGLNHWLTDKRVRKTKVQTKLNKNDIQEGKPEEKAVINLNLQGGKKINNSPADKKRKCHFNCKRYMYVYTFTCKYTTTTTL